LKVKGLRNSVLVEAINFKQSLQCGEIAVDQMSQASAKCASKTLEQLRMR